MSDETTANDYTEQGDARSPDDQRVDVDDAFEVTEEVSQGWEDDGVTEGEAPSG